MRNIIYDFETLSANALNAVVVLMASLEFDDSRFRTRPYTMEELISSAKVIKFDVKEQVLRFKREINRDTVEWWRKQPKELQKMIQPADTDVSIEVLTDYFQSNYGKLGRGSRAFTRGNSFDPVILTSILRHFGVEEPFNFWQVSDTRSYIQGLSNDMVDDKFIPDSVNMNNHKAHDPAVDIALDVMRIQAIKQIL